MKRRTLSIFLAAGLVASLFATAAPVAAQAPAVPAEPNVVDPAGDANYLNESMVPGAGHNNTTPADPSTVADLLAVWFSNDDTNISVHFQTEAMPPSTATGVTYQAFASPGEGEAGTNESGCLRFLINIPAAQANGGTYQDETWVRLLDSCNVGTSIFNDAIDGEFAFEEGPEGTGITTITFPRSYSPLLADDQALSGPFASSSTPTTGEHQNIGFLTPFIDDTEVGTDYAIQAGDEEKVIKKKDKKKNVKGKKKKGKKGGKRKKKPAACSAFQPGEVGAEAETVTVTDEATEEAPLEQTVTLDQSLADADLLDVFGLEPTDAYFNIQVDSANPDAGLYVFIEFPTRRDYDLNLLHTDGSYAARSRGFNTCLPACDGVISAPGHGGEPTDHSEKLVGIRTSDCGGWTQQVQNWLGEGGDFTVQVWLGEAQTDPQAPGEETP